MGKHRAVKRFIDANRVKVQCTDNNDAPNDLEKVIEKKIEEIQPKEKKVSFQLKCDLPVEREDEELNQNPISGERKDLSCFEIYYKDDYDYLKHLKARDDVIWEDEGMELSIAPKPDLQQKKKDRRKEKKLKKHLNQAPEESSSANYGADVIFAGELDEEAARKLFSDADFVDDLPDNLVAILDGAASDVDKCPIFNDDEDEDINFMAEGEVDYSKMPPLEQLDHVSDEDWRSDISCDFMDVSDEEYEDVSDSEPPFSLENNDDNFPSLQATKNIIVKAPKKLQTAKDFIIDSDEKRPAMVMSLKDFQKMPQEKLDRFFEGVAEASDEEGGYQATEAECPQSGVPSSKTAVKDITEKVDMLNEHFNAMLVREYKRSDVCGDGLEDVEGALDEDAPQFHAAVAADRSGRPLDGRAHLSVPFDGRESNADKELRNEALNFCKNWRETKEELVEVAIPDRHAMMYNATNLPVVRNKNFPALIKPDLPLYFNQKKKKGLTVKDIRAHDREMNAPTSNEEDAQTFKTMLTELSYRPPDESSADRRDRKTAVRELRRGRREEKKLNQLAHKEMVLQTSKVLMHARHYRNTAVI